MKIVNDLIDWALTNRFIVLIAGAVVALTGFVCFLKINVEAYPDPAPALVEVIAQWSGASAEEMERQVTIPLEVSLAGMPDLKVTYSKSLFGLTHLRCVFNYGHPYKDARQEVINRLSNLTQPLPAGVNPVISPASPIGEIYRYTLKTPKNSLGQEIYTLSDIKALEDWLIERQFRRVPRIIDISSFGGTVKRYEIQPDPRTLKKYGITLNMLQNAIANSNANVGGDFLVQGRTSQVVRVVGTISGGKDPMEKAFGMGTPEVAAAFLREEEQIRLREIRKIVITTVNNLPVTIDDVVVGGRLDPPTGPSLQGVVVSFQTRLGMIAQDKAMDAFQITDKTLDLLTQDKVPDKIVDNLKILKDRPFDSKQFFLKSLSVDRYRITDENLEAMHKDHVPREVLAKLGALKNKLFETREFFALELNKVLTLDEMETYQGGIAREARSQILSTKSYFLGGSDYSRYKDRVLDHAEGVRYVVNDNVLNRLKSKGFDDELLKKFRTLKGKEDNKPVFMDVGFKNRESFVKALTQIPELQFRYLITEDTLKDLRAEGVRPEKVRADAWEKLESLKGVGFSSPVEFSHKVSATLGNDVYDSYEFTKRSLESLADKSMPQAVQDKLAPLKDRSFPNSRQASIALAGVLDKHEMKRYADAIFTSMKRLRDLLPDLADMDIRQDVVMDEARTYWRHQDEKVQGVVLMRKGEESLPSIEGVKKKVEELNQPGRLLPGVELETYYDREDLVHLTTHTVEENLIMGIVLVVIILMMFLSNIKTAIIVALNIPLALLFAFAVLFFRGQSANLLSIGAVDFGIIVDSAVIMTENIFRNLSEGHHAELPIKERILKATREIDKALFFSTAIMVVAFIPLFTMQGAEGQLFGPMAQTYAFALGGALFMALTLTPVLCSLLLQNVKPVPENFLVRFMKHRYLSQLKVCLKYPVTTCAIMTTIIVITAIWPLAHLGREFMPELEEGSLWIRGIYPVNTSLDTVRDSVFEARKIMCAERYPEVSAVVAQIGRPDDGTDPGLFNNVEVFVPLRPEKDWPHIDRPNGEHKRRTRRELVSDMNAELSRKLPGVEWQFSQYIRDNVMEAISGVKGDNCVKIFGPDLDKLEELAEKTKAEMGKIRGLHDLGIYRIMGQSNLEFVVDKDKCKRYGVQVADVNAVINSAVHGNALTQMVEGEKLFDITLRWPLDQRWDRSKILEIPVDIWNNTLTPSMQSGSNQTLVMGPSQGISASGTSLTAPAPGSVFSRFDASNMTPRLYLKHFVSPISREDWRADPDTQTDYAGSFTPLTPGVHSLKLLAGKTYVFSVSGARVNAKLKLLDGKDKEVWSREAPREVKKTVSVLRATDVAAMVGNGSPLVAGAIVNKRTVSSTYLDGPDLNSSFTPTVEGTYRLEVTTAKDLPNGGANATEYKYTLTVRTVGGDFLRPAGSIITREDGKRFIAVKFSVRGDRDLASVVGDVREKTASIFQPPYFMAMGGEFEQMEDGERRLLLIIPASLVLIFMLLYVAFTSLLDAVVIMSNVLDLAVGGIWALYLTGTNFSMSAAVGFVSLFGVAIMDGLLMIGYFNHLRARGLPVPEAIMEGAAVRVRPVTMTCLTAILGLLPAAFSTAIGSQTQRPLAIVVVGGMVSTLFLTRYLMPVIYSFYGHRAPPEGAAHMAH